MQTYPIVDRIPRYSKWYEILKEKGIRIPVHRYSQKIKAIKTREFRKPKKGEFYLSGAIPEASVAPNDLNNKFWIADLVLVQKVDEIIRLT